MHSSTKRVIGFILMLSAIFGSAFALDVNQNELQSAGSSDKIKFSNYSGPHSVISTADAIRNIGSIMGKTVSASPEKETSVNPDALYSVIHAVDLNDTKGLDADIILINKGAGVDHIDNVRRIITGYLMQAYSYDRKDAETLAVFITVYNAVYRNDIDTFASKYKAVVLKYLTKEKCGISTIWSEWAGNTQLVIPLYDVNANLSSIETSILTDKNVISNLQEQDDKGIDVRKDMVDLKEREADIKEEAAQEAAQEAAALTKEAQDAKKEANKADADADKAEKAADKAQKEADKAQKASDADPDNQAKKDAAEEAAKKAQEAQEAADEARAAADRAQEKADEAADAAKRAQDEASANQDAADKKMNEAQTERTEIAKDQKKLLKEERASRNMNTVAGLRIKDAVKGFYAIVKVDTDTGNVVKESPVNMVRGRNIFAVTDCDVDIEDDDIDTSVFYLAICGQNSGQGAVKLCLIDNSKLEIQKESTETIHEDSVLVKNEEDFYCVITNGSSCTVGKFDKSLNLLLKSDVEVTGSTPIVITEKGIVVTDAKGKVVLLDLARLNLVSK